jgi:predicted GNAT family acetyltransferase
MRVFKDPGKSTERVTKGRFEIERDGGVAYLEYALAGPVLELIHTEVPKSMSGSGIGSTLIQSALDWSREHNVKVDVICPFVAEYLKKHPEYSDLLVR